MIAFQQVVTEQEATDLLEKVRSLDDAYFVDRSEHFPNPSLDGSLNKYLSMSDDAMPWDIKETMFKWFPDSNVEQILINRYYPQMNIGPHIDSNMYRYVSVMFLDKDLEVLSLKLPEHGWFTVKDVPGKMVTISRDVVHKVDPVPVMRHSVIVIRDSL